MRKEYVVYFVICIIDVDIHEVSSKVCNVDINKLCFLKVK